MTLREKLSACTLTPEQVMQYEHYSIERLMSSNGATGFEEAEKIAKCRAYSDMATAISDCLPDAVLDTELTLEQEDHFCEMEAAILFFEGHLFHLALR